MLGADEGGAAGASGAITSLMMIAALWAPRNKLTVFIWILIIARTVELSVLTFCAIWIGLEIFFALLSGFSMSSAVLHLIGAGVGLAAGVFMLKRSMVDTEGWDFLSLRHGDPRRRAHLEARAALAQDPRVTALVKLRDALEEGDAASAEFAYAEGQRGAPGWVLGHDELLELVSGLRKADRADLAIPRMEELIRAYPDRAVRIRLALASDLAVKRPGRALELLAAIQDRLLNESEQAVKRKLERRAQIAREQGGLELD